MRKISILTKAVLLQFFLFSYQILSGQDSLSLANRIELTIGSGFSAFSDYDNPKLLFHLGFAMNNKITNRMNLINEFSYQNMGHNRSVQFYDETGSLIRANIVRFHVPYVRWKPSIDIGNSKISIRVGGYFGVRLPTMAKSNYQQSAVEPLGKDYNNTLKLFDWGGLVQFKFRIATMKSHQLFFLCEFSHGIRNIDSNKNQILSAQVVRNVGCFVGLGLKL